GLGGGRRSPRPSHRFELSCYGVVVAFLQRPSRFCVSPVSFVQVLAVGGTPEPVTLFVTATGASRALLWRLTVLERARSPASEAVVGRVLRDAGALAGDGESCGVEPRALPGKTGAAGELVAGDRDVDERELRLGD